MFFNLRKSWCFGGTWRSRDSDKFAFVVDVGSFVNLCRSVYAWIETKRHDEWDHGLILGEKEVVDTYKKRKRRKNSCGIMASLIRDDLIGSLKIRRPNLLHLGLPKQLFRFLKQHYRQLSLLTFWSCFMASTQQQTVRWAAARYDEMNSTFGFLWS